MVGARVLRYRTSTDSAATAPTTATTTLQATLSPFNSKGQVRRRGWLLSRSYPSSTVRDTFCGCWSSVNHTFYLPGTAPALRGQRPTTGGEYQKTARSAGFPRSPPPWTAARPSCNIKPTVWFVMILEDEGR